MIRFEIRDAAFQRRLKQVRKRSQKRFDEILQNATNKMHQRQVNLAPKGASKSLWQNIRITGKGITESKMNYSSSVEHGAEPHWPNPEDLELWVKRKLKPSPKRLKSVSFLVARKISEKGTPAQPFMKPGWEHGRRVFMKDLKNEGLSK